MKRLATFLVIVPALLTTACYHAIVETGRSPSATVINRHFQPSFIYGLVPPPPLNVAGQCPNGLARVETQHTFVEGLVGAITFGIFTPMTITATCASGTSMLPGARVLDVGQNASAAAQGEAIERAAAIAEETGSAVYVRF